MQFKLTGITFSYGANTVLDNINLEIKDKQKIAVVGRNGCGKTTLLKLICGDLLPDRDFTGNSEIIKVGVKNIGIIRQIVFENNNETLLNEIKKSLVHITDLKNKLNDLTAKMQETDNEDLIKEYSETENLFRNIGGYYYEKEYETLLKKFGFCEEDKQKPLKEFSGGQRTKIAFIKLLLQKPDILLLDEPTNHLDISAIEWLEEYIKSYPSAVVIVSHDRMFLDRTVNGVYEIENGKTEYYAGNYTEFISEKKRRRAQQYKEYAAQQKEIERLQTVINKFKGKPTKVSMAHSKEKAIEHMEKTDAPAKEDLRTFNFTLTPATKSFKEVLTVENLGIGYNNILTEITLNMERGDKIGIVGGNGLGKSTFLKTLIGTVPYLSGKFEFGRGVTVGYFDQQIADINNGNSVLDEFMTAYPAYTQNEARNALGAFLFSGEDVFKKTSELSGGEKVRLSLCKIFNRQPNFLILDEPTNHMDIIGKEALEDLLLDYDGTLLFVSHDRYFIEKVATALLIFENGKAEYFNGNYEKYRKMELSNAQPKSEKQTPKKEKKTYTTPAKEEARRIKRIAKLEEEIAISEETVAGIKAELEFPENVSDFIKLSELQALLEEEQIKQDALLNEWESLQ